MGKAFQYGILYAYRAVTKPVEGTILSVARGIAKGTYEVIRQEPDFSKVWSLPLVMAMMLWQNAGAVKDLKRCKCCRCRRTRPDILPHRML